MFYSSFFYLIQESTVDKRRAEFLPLSGWFYRSATRSLLVSGTMNDERLPHNRKEGNRHQRKWASTCVYVWLNFLYIFFIMMILYIYIFLGSSLFSYVFKIPPLLFDGEEESKNRRRCGCGRFRSPPFGRKERKNLATTTTTSTTWKPTRTIKHRFQPRWCGRNVMKQSSKERIEAVERQDIIQ